MSARSTPPPDASLRILIVEDDHIVASDLRATMERLGHTVSGPAITGEGALALARKRRPDLALVDIRLSGELDGSALAEALRRDLEIPVVFLTGYSSDAVFSRAREAGPAGYLRKPFSDGELTACLAAALEQEATRKEHRQQAESMCSLVADLDDAVILTELDGRVSLMNPAAEALTGWTAAEAMGRRLRSVAPLSEVDTDSASDFETEPGNRPSSFRPMILSTRDGEAVSVLERSSPLRTRGAEGEAHGLLCLMRRVEAATETVNTVDPESPLQGEPPARGPALAKATELSRQPAFRELLGHRATEEDNAPRSREAEDETSFFFDEAGAPPEDAPPVATTISPLDEIGDPLLNLDARGRIVYANAEALVYFGGSNPLIGSAFWGRFEPEAGDRCYAEFRGAVAGNGRHQFEIHDRLRGHWLEVCLYRTGSSGEEGGVLALFRNITSRKRAESESVRLHRLEGLGLLARGFAHDFNNLLTVLIGSLELASERYPGDADLHEDLGNASRAAGDARDLVQQLMTFSQGGRPILEPLRIADLLRQLLTERRQDHPGIRYQFQSGDSRLVAHLDRRQVSRLLENLILNSEQAMPDGGALIARCRRITGDAASRLRNVPTPAEEDHVVIEIIDTGRGMAEEELRHAFEPYYTTRGGMNASGIGLTVCESIAKAHDGFIMLQSKRDRGTIATVCLPLQEAVAGSTAPPDPASLELPSNVFMPRQVETPSLPAKPDSLPGQKTSEAPAPAAFPRSFFESPPEPEDGVEDDVIPSIMVPSAPTTDPEEAPEKPARIIILEDDSLIRRLIAVTLRRDGYEVIETADGHDTVRLYEEALQEGDPFDLVLSDLTIEHGLGGVETMRALKHLDPEVLAIVSSGYSDAPAMARPTDFGFSAVLPKPYPPRDLRKLVAEMLERHRRRGESQSRGFPT